MTITDYLSRHPRTKREVARMAGIATRDVEKLVQEARLNGAPIISDDAGYRLSDDPSEVRDCANRLRHRYVTQALTARALKRTATRLEKPTLGLV